MGHSAVFNVFFSLLLGLFNRKRHLLHGSGAVYQPYWALEEAIGANGPYQRQMAWSRPLQRTPAPVKFQSNAHLLSLLAVWARKWPF